MLKLKAGWISLLVYPLIIIVLGKWLEKLPVKIRTGARVVLAILLVIYIKDLLMADPTAAEAIK